MMPNTEISAIASVLVAILVLLVTLAVVMHNVVNTDQYLKKRRQRDERRPDPRFGLSAELEAARIRAAILSAQNPPTQMPSAQLPGVTLRPTQPPAVAEPPKRQPVNTTKLPRRFLPTSHETTNK